MALTHETAPVPLSIQPGALLLGVWRKQESAILDEGRVCEHDSPPDPGVPRLMQDRKRCYRHRYRDRDRRIQTAASIRYSTRVMTRAGSTLGLVFPLPSMRRNRAVKVTTPFFAALSRPGL